MKTLSGTVKLVVLAAVAVVTAIMWGSLAQSAPTSTTSCDESDPPQAQTTFILKIKPRHSLKDDSDATKKAFRDLLNNGHYSARGNKMHLRHATMGGGTPKPDECFPTSGTTSSKIDIQTDKVTASEMAKNLEAGELTVIQPHVTVQVASSSSADIKAVIDLLAP